MLASVVEHGRCETKISGGSRYVVSLVPNIQNDDVTSHAVRVTMYLGCNHENPGCDDPNLMHPTFSAYVNLGQI